MKRPPVVAGLLFVALGGLMLADQAFAAVDTREIIASWWPLALVLAGLGQAMLPPRNPSGGAVLGLLGGMLLLWTLDVVDTLAFVLPVLLIAFGVWLIAGRAGRPSGSSRHEDAQLSVVTVFSDRELEGPRGPFQGGDVTTVFGDTDLDLSHARIDGEAQLQITTVFGDLDVWVPDGWRVRITGPQLLGDVRVADPIGALDDGPSLVLRMVTVFGDVEVHRSRGTAAD